MKTQTENSICLKCGKRENKLGWNTMSCNCKEPETISSLKEERDEYKFGYWFYYFAFILGVLFIGFYALWKLGGFN